MNAAPDFLIQIIEEKAFNAWAAVQVMIDDGWLLRFAEGYTKRANSINFLHPGTQKLPQKIKRCEQIYIAKNLQPVFRITPLAPPQLSEALDRLGYEEQDYSSVQIKDLTAFEGEADRSLQSWTDVSSEWLNWFGQLAEVSVHQHPALTAILKNIVPNKCFAVLIKGDRPVACGLAVLEDQYVGLFEIVTAADQRRRGFATELILQLLSWAKSQGAKTAYLQVVLNNLPALRLYSQLGFEELYQYVYRIKPQEAKAADEQKITAIQSSLDVPVAVRSAK